MSLFPRLLLMGLFMVVLCVGFLVGAYYEIERAFAPTPVLAQAVTVTIPAGAGSHEIGAALKQAGIIRSSFWFRVMVSWYAIDQRLKPGSYPFRGGEDLNTVIHALVQGREEKVRVTIPEGLKLVEIAQVVERAGIASAATFLQAIQ
ncbi:MAG TPA: endolytic transglycosylase MltG, partial [Candidatus Ozemobacteraceae bacterium]|nr:endolytic transglycosylase MltG [Candidatus Ozemobacteraceae bacterium]